MHADYIANPLYDNNPFIEALPPMLSGKDLIHALAVIPPYNDSNRSAWRQLRCGLNTAHSNAA